MVWCIPLKASQAQPKVGPCSIFMKLALCEIGFCLMDPCMGALPDTSAPAYRHQSRNRGQKEGEEEKGEENREQCDEKMSPESVFKQKKKKRK